MGASSNNKKDRKNEVLTDESSLHQVNSFLYEVCPSVCKIIASNLIGTGFFIKLYKENKPLFVLMTNEHVIKKDMIEKNEKIEVYYNNQKNRIIITLNQKERFIQTYKEKLGIDCTIVEILSKDNVNENYFLHPNLNYNLSNYKELKNKIISVVQFPGGANLSHSKGKLTNINKYEFTHKASTLKGSSGSPIFLGSNTNVIGIHKSGSNKEKENYGDFIFRIINLLNNNLIHKQNELKVVGKAYVHGILLFGNEFIKNNKDKCELFINGKNIALDKIGDIYFLKEVFDKYDEILYEIILKETKIITNMDYMLCPSLQVISINFENWDVSNVTSMKRMFNRCYNIKGISNWNTSKVTNMSHMFKECNNIPDISGWDTSNVLDMSYMFSRCSNIPNISKWDTSNVKNMSGLFYYSARLLPDISNWNTSSVENMSKMFDRCKSLKSLPNISKWDTSRVKDMSHMFHHC